MYLASFVNQQFTPSFKLGVLDNELKLLGFLMLDSINESSGITGLCSVNETIYACVQGKGILVLNKNLEQVQHYESELIKDPHSIIYDKGSLKVVSTGTNKIIQLTTNTNGIITNAKGFWQFPGLKGYDYDFVHLNSIASFKNDLYISYFGEREFGSKWESNNKGGVIRIKDNSIVTEKLNNPHTLFVNNENLFVCNSGEGTICDIDKKIHFSSEGYVRGVCMDLENSEIKVCINSRRQISKSNYKILQSRIGNPEREFEPYITSLNIEGFQELSKTTFQHYGREIYDLIKIPKSTISHYQLIPFKERVNEFEKVALKTIHQLNKTIEELKIQLDGYYKKIVLEVESKEKLVAKINSINFLNNEYESLLSGKIDKEVEKELDIQSLSTQLKKLNNENILLSKENLKQNIINKSKEKKSVEYDKISPSIVIDGKTKFTEKDGSFHRIISSLNEYELKITFKTSKIQTDKTEIFSDIFPPMPFIIGPFAFYDFNKKVIINAKVKGSQQFLTSFTNYGNWIKLSIIKDLNNFYTIKINGVEHHKSQLIEVANISTKLTLGCGLKLRFWSGEVAAIELKDNKKSRLYWGIYPSNYLKLLEIVNEVSGELMKPLH